MYILKKILLLTLVVLPIQGCQFFKDVFGSALQRPHVSVVDLQVLSLNQKELKLKIKLLVQNPNRFPLEISDLNYQISLSKELVAEGEYLEKAKFPQEENKELVIPLRIASKKAHAILRRALAKKSALEVSLLGWVNFHSSFGAIKIDFSYSRELFGKP